MANDNDFLNQKIIPAEENLGDHNNEHKQIVLYCAEGWHKQKGLSQGCQSHRQKQNQRMNNCPSLFISSRTVINLTLFRKGAGTGGCKEGLIHGHCIHLLIVPVRCCLKHGTESYPSCSKESHQCIVEISKDPIAFIKY